MGHDKDQLGTTEWNLGEIRMAKFLRQMCVAFEKDYVASKFNA